MVWGEEVFQAQGNRCHTGAGCRSERLVALHRFSPFLSWIFVPRIRSNSQPSFANHSFPTLS